MNARRVALVLSFGLAEASVILPLIRLVPTPLSLFEETGALAVTWLVICAIAATRRGLALRDAAWNTQRVAMGLWLAGLLIVSIAVLGLSGQQLAPFEVAVLVELAGVLLVWWRGASLGASDLQPDAARLRLQIGLLMFVIFGTATMLDRSSDLFAYIVPFLIGALFALPLSHLERIEHNKLGKRIRMDRTWWLGILVGVLPTLAVSLIATALFTGDMLARGFQLLIAILLAPLLLIGILLGVLISELFSRLFRANAETPNFNFLGDLLKQLNEQQTQAPNPVNLYIPEGVRIILVVVGVGLFIAFISYFTERQRRGGMLDQADTETLPGALPENPVPDAVKRIVNALDLRRWLAALTVRRIYARMSHEAEKRGHPRLPAQTPYDYVPSLQQAYPGSDAEVDLITRAYVDAHYGELPETAEELNLIKAAWERARVNRAHQPLPAQPSV